MNFKDGDARYLTGRMEYSVIRNILYRDLSRQADWIISIPGFSLSAETKCIACTIQRLTGIECPKPQAAYIVDER